MPTRLQVNKSGLRESAAPNVYIRTVALDVGKLNLHLSIILPAQNADSIIPETSLKVIVSHDRALTKRIVAGRESITNDFNRPGESIQRTLILKQNSGFDYKMRTSDGVNLYKKSIFLTFDDPLITEGELEHLSCMAVSFLRNTNQVLDVNKVYSSQGKISTEVIFDDGQMNVGTQALYDSNGALWPGSVNVRRSGEYLSGARPHPGSLDLIRSAAPNSKIHDYRVFRKILNFTETNQNGTPLGTKKAQFTDLFLSFDHDRKIRGLCGISCREIYKNNAKYKRIIEEPILFSQLMSSEHRVFEDVEVYRYRSDTKDPERDLVAKSRDSNSRKIIRKVLLKEEKRIGIIEEIFLGARVRDDIISNSLRYLSFTDLEIAEKNSGVWHYVFEFKIRDITEDFFRNKDKLLQRALSDLKTYTERSKKYMNFESKQFIQGFWENNQEANEGLLQRCIVVFLENVLLMQQLTTAEQRQIARVLLNITHPISGNVDGLRFFIRMVMKQLARNQKALSKTNPLSKKKETFNSSIDHAKKERNIISVVKNYSRKEESHSITCSNRTGMEYLTKKGRTTNGSGLVVLSMSDWRRRISDENRKYSVLQSTSLLSGRENRFQFSPENLENSYLGPNFIRVGDNVLDLEVRSKNFEYAGLNALLLNRREDKKASTRDKKYYQNAIGSEERAVRQVLELSEKKTISLLTEAEKRRVKQNSSYFAETREKQDASNFLSKDSKFNTSEKEKRKFIDATVPTKEGMLKNTSKVIPLLLELNLNNAANDNEGKKSNVVRASNQKKDPIRKSNEKLNLGNRNNVIDTVRDLSQVPNQVMSLLVNTPVSFRSGEPGQFNRNFSNSSEFSVKYSTLRKVEALVGYDVSTTDPTWRVLDSSLIQNMQGAYLCRITAPVTINEMGIKDNFDCPVFNQYFILGNPFSPTRGGGMGEISSHLAPKNVFVPPEFLDSYSSLAATSRGHRSYILMLESNIAPESRPRSGRTSTNSRHFHTFDVDEQGNGIAVEAAHPTLPHVRHSHVIKNWRVQPAESESIDPVNGLPSHIHALENLVSPSVSRQVSPRGTTAAPRNTGATSPPMTAATPRGSAPRGGGTGY